MAASSSVTNFTLSFHHRTNKAPKFSTLNPFKNTILSSRSSNPHHLKLRQHFINPHISSIPISKPSILASSSPPKKTTTHNFFVGKIATLLLGSLIFMGSVKSRLVVAKPVQESATVDSQNIDDSEEEIMCAKLVRENPKNIDTLKMVVNVKMKKGKSSEAVEYVEKLIELQGSEMEWRLLQALCYEMMGDLSKAKSLFKNILEHNPLLLRALHVKRVLDYAVVVIAYKLLDNRDRDLLPDFQSLGLAMVMHKNKEGPAVFEMLERALEIARRQNKVNEERNIRILVAQMHIIKGNLEEALENFQNLIEENPRDFRPYLCQGIVYSLLEEKTEAAKSFEIYRRLVPEEFPQRGFLDDVVLAAKTDSKQQLEKELQS